LVFDGHLYKLFAQLGYCSSPTSLTGDCDWLAEFKNNTALKTNSSLCIVVASICLFGKSVKPNTHTGRKSCGSQKSAACGIPDDHCRTARRGIKNFFD
jgi:hypothetical protein